MEMSNNYLTLKEVADRYGVEQHRVRYAIRAGYIKAEKKGWMLLIRRKGLPKKWPIGG
jgi:predicted transcriptional regulator